MGTLIQHDKRFRQRVDFSGLRIGSSYPTDIDAIYDCGGKGFIIAEIKTGDAPVPTGQKILLEHMIDRLSVTAPSIALIARHQDSTDNDIDAGAAIVTDYYFGNRWYTCRRTLAEMHKRFLVKYVPSEWKRLSNT